MMNRWQKTIVDERGNIVPWAVLIIRNESDQMPATVYRDRDGTDPYPTGQVVADGNGFAFFYAAPGLYRITSQTPVADWRDVGIGAPFDPSETVPDASESARGIIQIATSAEAVAGESATKAVTPAALASVLAVNAGIQVYSTAGIFTWAVPAVLKSGAKKAKVIVTGGGGTGRYSGTGNRGAGGGAGGTAIKLVDLTGISTVSVSTGSAGWSSSFGTYCSATGGVAGGPDGTNYGGPGGTGVGGDINIDGGAGADGVPDPFFAAASGGGQGGASYWGGGGRGASGVGVAGAAPGSGGGGGTQAAGGTGADGIVTIEW